MTEPIKMILVGESGAGKTGSLASLLSAGYNVRVLDLDNGVEALVNLITDPKSVYKKDSIDRLSYITLTEKQRFLAGRITPASATVWQKSVDALGKWKATKPREEDLGSAYSWDEKTVLVLDTLGSLGAAARNFHLQMNGDLGKIRSSMENMRDIGTAQQYLLSFLEMVRDTSLKCHVIVSAHIDYSKADGTMPQPGEADVTLYGFPAAIGRKMLPKIPSYFNHMIMARADGTVRRIYTKQIGNVALKSGAPLKVKPIYNLDQGLAEYFRDVGAPL